MDKKIATLISIITIAIFIGGIFLVSKNPQKSVLGEETFPDIIKADTHTKGNKDAKVTIVEFGDYECPACSSAHPYVLEVLNTYGDSVYFAYRHFPLTQHKSAQVTAEAAEAANAQGKFWEMHDLLYQKQDEWVASNNPKDKIIEYAGTLGLDVNKFTQDLNNNTYKERVNSDQNDGIKVQVNATPTFYINGSKFNGNFSELSNVISDKLQSQ